MDKRPLWQWILIYAAAGIVVYGLIYFLVLSKRGESTYAPASPNTGSQISSPSATRSQDTITLEANGFSPASLTVKAGTTVSWVNKSGVAATVNSSSHPSHTDYSALNLGNLPDGGILSLTFDKPGTYTYHNHLIPSQNGTIIVE